MVALVLHPLFLELSMFMVAVAVAVETPQGLSHWVAWVVVVLVVNEMMQEAPVK
jgi:hypothetical protein